ncbi:MAG: hydrogenase [Desulfamplus sp.]|nr:hydrogenase [Desulfamplus sp.]
MTYSVDTVLSLALLSSLFAIGSSRLPGLIKVVGFQGIIVSIVPIFIDHNVTSGAVTFYMFTMTIRGFLIPLGIYLLIRKIAIRREVQPIVGYNASLFVGLLIIIAASIINHKLVLPATTSSVLLMPTAITILVTGMFILMARRNAIAMVLGYIMMENGIYLVGTTFSMGTHHIVEFGILLDVLAGVMIMAIMLENMKQKFDDVDTAFLSELKE